MTTLAQQPQREPLWCNTCNHKGDRVGTTSWTCLATTPKLYLTCGPDDIILQRVGCASHSEARPHPPAPENPCIENGCTDIENCDEICQHSRIYSPVQIQEAKTEAYESGFGDGYHAGKADEHRTATLAAKEELKKEFTWMRPICFGKHEAICDTRCAWVVRQHCVNSLRQSTTGDEQQ